MFVLLRRRDTRECLAPSGEFPEACSLKTKHQDSGTPFENTCAALAHVQMARKVIPVVCLTTHTVQNRNQLGIDDFPRSTSLERQSYYLPISTSEVDLPIRLNAVILNDHKSPV